MNISIQSFFCISNGFFSGRLLQAELHKNSVMLGGTNSSSGTHIHREGKVILSKRKVNKLMGS